MAIVSVVRWLMAATGLFGLNVALTLQDLWPTPAVQWAGEVSIEVVALLLLIALARVLFGLSCTPLVTRLLAGLLVMLTLGRYAAITAPALYGRPINLYWDLPHVSNVVAMLTTVVPLWTVVAALAGVCVLLYALYALLLWCLRSVLWALNAPREAGLACAVGALVVLAYAARLTVGGGMGPFAEPVLATYGAQLRLLADGLGRSAASRALPASPALVSNLAALDHGDVVVMFLESYGSSTYDRPQFAGALAPVRAELAKVIAQTHRDVVSAFVESPTFGGGSWLAHLTLMSGINVRDPGRYAQLMTQQRDTLATPFRQHGYRTVGMMPGLRLAWPEGRFYHFDAIHDAAGLHYTGPEFGWFHIPDQFSLAKLLKLELEPAPRSPVFVLFPTLSTHLPFRPVPSYQPDWQRMLDNSPYDAADLKRSFAQTPAWLDMGESYVAALQYALTSLGGFLLQRDDPGLVIVLLGDHQPAANTSGENASWDVPVHIITGNQRVLATLRTMGFEPGLAPRRVPIGGMERLAPLLLRAFNAP